MNDLGQAYKARYDAVLRSLASELENHLRQLLEDEPRIDRVAARPKSVDRFVAKASKANDDGVLKYDDPINQIQDQIGARIITFYLSDVERVSAVIEKYLRPIEAKNLIPESEWQFGYFGKHYVLLIPSELKQDSFPAEMVPPFFELQIKTLFQHAWSEAEHDVGYKLLNGPLPPDATRKLAFTSAQAWGADHMFDDLFRQVANDAEANQH